LPLSIRDGFILRENQNFVVVLFDDSLNFRHWFIITTTPTSENISSGCFEIQYLYFSKKTSWKRKILESTFETAIILNFP